MCDVLGGGGVGLSSFHSLPRCLSGFALFSFSFEGLMTLPLFGQGYSFGLVYFGSGWASYSHVDFFSWGHLLRQVHFYNGSNYKCS